MKIADIYDGIWICRHICQLSQKCVDISAYFSPIVECADISMCWHMYQHLDVSTIMSASGHVNTFASTRTHVLTCMSAYLSPLVECAYISMCGIYVSILMCRHICRHLDMLTYLSAGTNMLTYMLACLATRICRHLIMSALWSASKCVGIYVGVWICRHICYSSKMCWHICRHISRY